MAHACDRLALVEAMFDERLGSTERASMDRHLETCPACRDELSALSAQRACLREAVSPISPLAHQRARLALLREAATPSAPAPARLPLAWLAAGLVSLPFAVWAGFASYAASRSPTAPITAPVASALSATAAAPLGPPASSPAAIAEAPSNNAPPAAAPTPSGPSSPRAIAAAAKAPLGSTSATTAATAQAPSAPPSSSAAREFADAMNAVSAGDFGSGAGKLERFAAAHPGDVRAEEAAYLHAIALQRSGRVAEAKAAARRYLSVYPQGAHRAQAERLLAD